MSSLKNLRLLQLNGTLITDSGIKTIAETFPHLQWLHVRHNPGVTKKALTYLARMPSLRSVTLTGCSISPEAMKAFFKTHPGITEHLGSPDLEF
jgi:hypothetical protein